jgi:hypothetical protein
MTTSTTEGGSSSSSSSLKLPGLAGIPGAAGATDTTYRNGVNARGIKFKTWMHMINKMLQSRTAEIINFITAISIT